MGSGFELQGIMRDVVRFCSRAYYAGRGGRLGSRAYYAGRG